MQKSQLKIGALLSYVVLALQNLVGLVYTPFMLRMMGKSEYGLYSIAASIVAYLTVLDLGFGNAIVRYTAKFRAEGKLDEQYNMFGMFFLLYCGIGIVVLLSGGALYLNAEKIFDASMTVSELSRTKVILVLMVANLAVTFPLSMFGSIITAYEQFVFQKVVTIIRIILNTVTMIVLLTFGYKAIAMVVVTTVFNVLTLGSHFLYCKYSLKVKLYFGKFKWGFLKEVSIYSLWIFMNAIMDRIYWSTGQFVLGAFVGTAAVAVFAVAIQLQHMYMTFSTAISGVFLPKVTAMTVKDPDGKAISDLFVKTGRIQYCVIILVLSGFFLFGRQFIRLWAGDGYDDAYVIAMIFFVPFTVPLIQNVGLVILQARNQMKFRCLLSLGVSVASLGIQIPLAKYYGGIGCAIGVAAGLVVAQIFVMNVYYKIRQKIDIGLFWYEISKMSIVPIAMTIVGYNILNEIVLDSWYKLGAGVVVYMLVYVPLFFVFSMNQYERGLVFKPFKKKNAVKGKKYFSICSSCGACANACPRGAITMQLDQEGFYKPVIDSDICSKCGTCERACPWLNDVVNPNDSSSTPKTIAAFAKNEEVRLASSSGGIFTVLAEQVLDEGGVVVGVAQLKPTHFGHVVIDNKVDLAKLRGSKYVQADAGLIYKQVRSLLRDGRKVLFSGTPCQVAALYAVLGKNHFGNLTTVDIVCHGTPSVKVFQKFVDEVEQNFSSSVENTIFRDKSTGWKRYSITQNFEDGHKQTNFYGESDYMNLFLNRICQNKSCAECHYRKVPRIADITLGDFWGVSNFHPEMDDDKGTSVVLLNTAHGEELFAQVSEQVVQCDSSLDNAVAGNPCIVRSSKEHFRRYEFFADLDKLTMKELVKKYCVRLPLYKILLLKIKKKFLDR